MTEQDPRCVHVYPMADAHAHKLEGTDCPCQPQIETADNGYLLILHKSFDGRELWEWLAQGRVGLGSFEH